MLNYPWNLLSPTVLLLIVLSHACFCVSRSTDYGVTFQDDSPKWPSDAKANWYYISQDDDDNVSRSTCIVLTVTHWCTISVEVV